MQANPGLKTIGELCDKVGIARMTYYRWSKDPDFRLWFARAWSAHLIMDGLVLINQARLLATRQFSYWKALFNLTVDPKGLPILQQWQQSCAQVDSDAFTYPEMQPDAVTGEAQSNQQKQPENVTKSGPPMAASPADRRSGGADQREAAGAQPPAKAGPACPTPVQHVRALRQLIHTASTRPIPGPS